LHALLTTIADVFETSTRRRAAGSWRRNEQAALRGARDFSGFRQSKSEGHPVARAGTVSACALIDPGISFAADGFHRE
jgi:hypothetical protein